MIHIKLGDEQPPEEWLEKARKLTEKLDAAANDDERNKIIVDNSKLWGDLKIWLLKFSHGKCWFSETNDCYSHMDVEHFRPKKSAKDLDGTEREGYWWLAFDWHNYRICGNVGNRKKGTLFPLHPQSQKACSTARGLVDDEICLFLDPTREGDPELLSFNEEGMATSMPGIPDWPRQRAEESIKSFKLNEHVPLQEARRKHWAKCRKKIELARDAMKINPPTATSHERFRKAIEELQEMLCPQQPFSALSRECLNASGHRWAQRIVCRAG